MFIVPVSRFSTAPRRAASVRSLDRLFDDAVGAFLGSEAADDSAPVRRPALDVAESGDHYVVTLDVPGVSREDVKVSIDGRRVAVVAEARAKAEPGAEAAAQPPEAPQATAQRVILRERAVARFARSFTLPAEIDQGASQARLENGVLTLTLTRRQASAAQLTVN